MQGYRFCKMVSLGQKLKIPKQAKNHSTRTLQLLCAKNRSKKQQTFEKWENFQNWPSCKGYSLCKGYKLCKMVRMGQKLKMPKTCEKPLYKNISFVLCKNFSKKHQLFEKWNNFQNRPFCKDYSPCKRFSLFKMVKLGQKLKMAKTCEKLFCKNIACFLCKKKLSKKHQMFQK